METKTNLERILELEKEVEELKCVVASYEDNSKKANEINSEMRKKYTPSAEFAIIRKSIALLFKANGISYKEFDGYNSWAETHKTKVKEEIALQEANIKTEE